LAGLLIHAIQDLQEGDDKSSNFGTLDIIACFRMGSILIYLCLVAIQITLLYLESLLVGIMSLVCLLLKKAKGLFHKAISQSGYTTSISTHKAYRQDKSSPTSEHTSWKIVNKVLDKAELIILKMIYPI